MNTLSYPLLILVAGLSTAGISESKVPPIDEFLAKYDAIMGPESFEGTMTMTAHREDGTEKTYEMRAMKQGDDKFRVWFNKPAAVAGQEMLRIGDNSWIYLPNLKRATRIANRDSFQGGDFNNADVLRVNYKADYQGVVKEGEDSKSWLAELKAKGANTSYDIIKLWVMKDSFQPLKGEYYGTSGKLIRSATFSEHKEFQPGYTRPAKIEMKNELIKARYSQMTMMTMKVGGSIPTARFNLNDLGN